MSIIIAVTALAVSFQMVSPPADAPKPASFALQGYVSDSDHTLVDVPQFTPPAGSGERPSAYVTFESPITGTCGVAMWETVEGKTSVDMRKVVDMHQGERQFLHILLPTRDDLSRTNWRSLPLDHYGITAICAVTEGPGAGPQTMVQSNFYVAPAGSST